MIASDLGAPGSMIRHGVDGLLFPVGDVAALRATLARLAADPTLLDKLQTGILPVRTEADHVDQIDDIYGQALSTTIPSSD